MRIDSDFEGVIDGCAASRPGRRTTWINERIRALYRDLFDLGYCHTVETWAGRRAGRRPLRRGARTAPSSARACSRTARDASKVALVYLCARLTHGGFSLLDTQFVTEHLKQFGTVEIDRDEFQLCSRRRCGSKAISCRCRRQPRRARFLAVLDARFKPREARAGLSPIRFSLK